MSPNYELRGLLVILLAFAAYYLGIFIRKRVFPGRRSLSLRKQLLLGIPVSLIVVPAMVPIIEKTSNSASVLITLGLIMEQGMVLNEIATRRLKALIQQGGAHVDDEAE